MIALACRSAAPWFTIAAAALMLNGCTGPGVTHQTDREADRLDAKATAFHERRALNDAASFYRKVLELDQPRDARPEEVALALRFLPRLHAVPGEYFPLKDIVAVLHPDRPIIGYHLFWEDDVDFPDDNDPCDHEIVWIEYAPGSLQITRVYTYFHGTILQPAAAVEEANAHSGRAWIGVEWGKHGSVPWDAAGLKSGPPNATLKENWEVLHTQGTRLPDHPLAKGWPRVFPGDFEAYRNFAVPVDAAPLLKSRSLIKVSRWPNAVLSQHCLRYNFAPKTEWPWSRPL